MYAVTSNRRYENSLVTLDGGSTRTLAASRFAWVDGWVDNSTLTIDGRDSASGAFSSLPSILPVMRALT